MCMPSSSTAVPLQGLGMPPTWQFKLDKHLQLHAAISTPCMLLKVSGGGSDDEDLCLSEFHSIIAQDAALVDLLTWLTGACCWQ